MRTLLIARFFPPIRGGSPRWYEAVYSRYPKNSIVVLTQETDGWQSYDRTGRLPTIRIRKWGNVGIHPKFTLLYRQILKKANQLIKKGAIQIIHCDTVLPAGLVGVIAAKKAHLPCVLYAHGEEIKIYSKLFPEKYVIKYIYKKADGIIANSQFTFGELIRLGVEPKRLHLIYPGVDTEVFRPGLDCNNWKRRLNLNGCRVLLTVSRLSERKGHDQVIRALPHLLKRIPNLVYIIAGNGAEEERLKNLCGNLGVDSNVHFLGYVDDALLPSLYNVADVFVMPNRETRTGEIEGFGMVFIEANACGVPVVAGKSGGTASAVIDGKTGYLVNGNDVGDVAEKLRRLLEDKESAAGMGAYGRKRVVDHFTWQNCVAEIRRVGIE
jgi:phosphatidylinositol alpha-1,6-mannosyltransferase